MKSLLFLLLLVPMGASAESAFSMGNGEHNWIETADVQRSDDTLTFAEVNIDGNGWLIIHPVNEGVPDGDQYLGATYLESGANNNVPITVHRGLAEDEQILVMLHRDLNENRSFDFIFLADGNVVDRAVFEGTRMIGSIITVP